MKGQHVIPEALYPKTNLEGMEIIPFETAVVGTAIRFDSEKREIIVDLGYPWIGIIPENEATIYEFTYPEDKQTPRQIIAIIGTQIRAIVTEIRGNTLTLSRRLSMQEGWEALENGTIVKAYITGNLGYGIFLDIGNGIKSYNSRKECSTTVISNTHLWYRQGDIVNVKLLDKGENMTSKTICSRKLAYPGLDEADEIFHHGDVISVQIGMGGVEGGYYCCCTPNITGIVNSDLELKEGQVIRAVVRRVTPRGLKLRHVY